ncbi:MAG: PAS domain-containing protein [Magnetococcales bacterium]|nr:PAS domain-containing protein [Magnetococcales bacterium]
MKISFRSRLFFAIIFLLLVAELTIGLNLESGLRTWINHNAENELYRNAKAARELIVLAEKPYTIKEMDNLADRFGHAIDLRVTIIDPRGVVLGDSELDIDTLEQLENHGNRPEVKEALINHRGTAHRFSTTLNASMLYVATTYPHPDGMGVVRIQMSLADVERIIKKIHLFLLVAALWGLGVVIVIAGVSTHLLTRTLRSLAKRVNSFGNKGGPVTDEISGISGSFDQITQDLSNTLTSLSQEQNRFETVLEGMVEAVFALDSQGNITLVNQAAIELLEGSGTLLGQTFTQVIGGPEITELMEKAAAGGQGTRQFDLVNNPKKIRLLARVAALKNGGSVAVLHDISDIHRLEEVRREFVANVSHELRTPVSVIMANTETLLEEWEEDDHEPHPLMEALYRNASRLTDTISELLTLSRLDAGAYTSNIERLNLKSEVALQIEAAGLSNNRSQPIAMDVNSDLQINTDRHALKTILSNLLNNAIKYTNPDSKIIVRAKEVGDNIIIEVEDNGPGIAPQHQTLIFERFHRAVSSRSQTVGGTGLGLAIVSSYIEIMGGKISLIPAKPSGAIFQITLPTSTTH